MTENITATIKNQITAKQVTQGIIDGKKLYQIAADMGISREALYARTNKEEVKDLMILEVRELETKLQDWIMELHDSTNLNGVPNSANQRHAVTELGKMVKHVQDKLYPSIFRHETINVNIDLTELQTREHRFTEALNHIPPTCRAAFWEAYNNST